MRATIKDKTQLTTTNNKQRKKYIHQTTESKTTRKTKAAKKQIIKYFANQELGTSFKIDTHRRFNVPAIAKAYLGIDGEKISKIILSKDFKPFAKSGTNYTAIPGICQRKGDYDFALHHLVRLAFLHLSLIHIS